MLEAADHTPSGGVYTSPAGRQAERHRGEQAPLDKVIGIPYERGRVFLASSITDRSTDQIPRTQADVYHIIYARA